MLKKTGKVVIQSTIKRAKKVNVCVRKNGKVVIQSTIKRGAKVDKNDERRGRGSFYGGRGRIKYVTLGGSKRRIF